ncbi:MAG: hypothetical protein Q8O55_01540 [Dehalococcoidales bacterium]|nr:hypothetical protein [Dehalococcoidales bacterium]
MTQTEKYELALKLLRELNCPEEIMDVLGIWGIFVHNDEVKLHNWESLSAGGIIEGEALEITQEVNNERRNQEDSDSANWELDHRFNKCRGQNQDTRGQRD